MQAVILAAGRGTRMDPLSTVTPKPMLPIAEQPLVAHVADAAIAAGADELLFVVGYKADHVKAYFGNRYVDTPVTYAVQSSPSGTADAVRAASQYVDDDFLVLNGDNIFDPESIVALAAHDAAVAAHRVPDPQEYGVLSTDGTRATGIVEKPASPPSNLANAGAYAFPEAVLNDLDVARSERGERELTDVLARLIDRRSVSVVETKTWLDVARPSDLVRAHELVLSDRLSTIEGSVNPRASVEGVVQVAENATIAEDVILRGPVFVGHDATVERGATLEGPTSVGPGATVGRGAELSETVLLPKSEIDDQVCLHDVALGPECKLSAESHVAGLENESGRGTAAVVSHDEPPERPLTY